MSVRRLMATAGGLVIALAAVPRVQLHAQLQELRQDTKFILEAASSNLLEIRLGQLAQTKATNPAVKQFGQQMVTDHNNLENQLTTSISKNGTQFQPGMTKEDQQEADRLGKISGAEFDRSYMTSMIQHHQKDIAKFQNEGQSVRSAEARQIVATSLPILQQHLNMAIQVGNQVGVNTGVASTTPTGPVTTTPNPPVVTQQPGQVTSQTQADINADTPFIREAASANLMEVHLGQLAQSKATNQAVKQFGQRMVTDHTNLQNQLTATASAGGLRFTPSLDSRHAQQISRLERMSGSEFDQAYMQLMIQGHQEDVSHFQTQSQSARSAQVRTLAANSLPILQQHLSLAVQVGNQVGADTTTSVAGPNRPGGENRGDVRADAEFIRDAGAGNSMEIRLAELAQKKAKDGAVKRFAQREREDHTQLLEQWSSLAARNGMSVNRGMGELHREKIDKLEKVKDKNFDRAYMTLMVQHHYDMVTYWQKEGRASQSPQVRQLVNRGLPMLEQHFSEAKRIARQVGVDPNDALRNRTDIAQERGSGKDKNKNDK
jgi:putative membrane protein